MALEDTVKILLKLRDEKLRQSIKSQSVLAGMECSIQVEALNNAVDTLNSLLHENPRK